MVSLEDKFVKKISASVVLYNNSIEQLQRLLENFPFDFVELVVYDNSPTDRLRFFLNSFPCIYVNNNQNVGFGKGHNEAFKLLGNKSDYHIVLNPDVNFSQEVIREMVRFMNADRTIGLSAPKIKYPNGMLQHSCRLLPTPWDLFLRRIPVSFFKKRDIRNELQFSGYNYVMDVPFLLGCFLVFRSDIFKSIGGFDERYFMYLEDVDICRKVLNSSRIVFNSEVSVYHEYAKGSSKNFKLFKYHLLSAYNYFQKWGWIKDNDRNRINKKTLSDLNYKKL